MRSRRDKRAERKPLSRSLGARDDTVLRLPGRGWGFPNMIQFVRVCNLISDGVCKVYAQRKGKRRIGMEGHLGRPVLLMYSHVELLSTDLHPCVRF